MNINQIAEGCDNGACNQCGLLIDLGKCAQEMGRSINEHPALPVILGHLLFLCGDGIGPSTRATEAWQAHKDHNLTPE